MTKEVKDVAEVVSNEKYYLPGETFDKMAERIGMFMGLAEKEYELMFFWGTKFTDLIKNKKFIPGGRILANAGTYFDGLNEIQKKAYNKFIKNYNQKDLRCGQMLNCYVIPIKDSKHGPSSIYESLEDAADITAMEGGVGENFSELRPAGSPIRGNPNYKSSGPISFLKLYDANSKQLKQGGGRRGANMAVLDCDHPDIFEFVDCKRKEGDIDNYNISVGIYDKFMDAVDNDEMWDLKWNNMIYRTVSARSLFEKIVYNVWADGGGGEPGVIFLDTAAKYWPFNNEKPKSTNPCVTEDTWINTIDGPKKVKDLIGKKFYAVVNGVPYSSTNEGFWKTGNKDVYLLETYEGYNVKLTKDHKVYISDDEKIEAGKLVDGQEIKIGRNKLIREWDGEGTFDEGYLLGFLVGDGTFGGVIKDKDQKPILSVWYPSNETKVSDGVKSVMDFIEKILNNAPHRSDWSGWYKVNNRNEYRITSAYLSHLADKYGIYAKEKMFGEKIEKASSGFCSGIIAGFFDADGSIQDGHNLNIRITQNNLERLIVIQRILQRFGMFSRIYTNRKKSGSGYVDSKFNDENGTCEIVISKENILDFAEYIDIKDTDKLNKLQDGISKFVKGPYQEKFISRFKSLTKISNEDVYDVTIEKIHKFEANGIIVANCGEQFLGNYEACDLGAINLVSYVLFNTSTNKFEFDYKSFKEDIYTAIRFLDNVLDLNNYPLKYRNNVCETISMNHRRIGLGIMGLSDSLMLLGCEYGSNESIEVIKSIMNVFNSEAKLASVNLGNEKGLFLDQENAKDEFKHRRNCCVTTIAPTGTTSMLVGVSSGCEPNFGLVVKKKTTDGSGNVYFMVSESFKKLCSFNKIDLTDERLNEIYENKGSVQGLSWVPKYIQSIAKTTMDISPLDHVKVQCELQKYIENSISKTINLPRTATQKDVEDCIFSLWRGGAKGGTIYRDGTRQFQIMNVGGSESKQIVNNKSEEKPENRPDVLKGKTYKMVTNITTHKPENTYITINEDSTGRPFELFVHGSYDQSIINFLDFLINNGVKHDLAQMICAKMSQMSKENIGATTRLVSLCLRNNVPIVNVIKQLRKISNSDLYSIHKKIAKILSSYVGEKIKLDKCQNIIDNNPCGGNLMYQEGCLMCDLCGASKCE